MLRPSRKYIQRFSEFILFVHIPLFYSIVLKMFGLGFYDLDPGTQFCLARNVSSIVLYIICKRLFCQSGLFCSSMIHLSLNVVCCSI